MRPARLLSLGLLLLSARAVAADAAATAESDQRVSFGYRRFNEGDLAGALVELQRAQELAPNSEILLNIGLVDARMGRPVEAVAALDDVLKNPGALPPERLQRARHVRDEQAGRVGRLQIRSNVEAQVTVDNRDVGRAPMSEPVAVPSGLRLLSVVAPGHAPVRREVPVPAGQTVELTIGLEPIEGALAQIIVESQVPGADVVLDGKVVGRTPIQGSLPVPPGAHELVLRRSGYREARDAVSLVGGASRTLALTPAEAPGSTAAGTVRFRLSEPDADVVVDGKPRPDYREGLRLAAGVHDVQVSRSGFFPVQRQVLSEALATRTVAVTLEPTEETRGAQVSRATSQRRWAWATVAAGALLAGGAAALYFVNQPDLRDAEARHDELAPLLQKGAACDPMGEITKQCMDLVNDTNDRLDRAERTRTLAFIGMGTGAAVLVGGVILRALADDPHKYDYERPREQLDLGVFAGIGPGALTAGMRGRF
jgi:hypothetical protein